MIAILAHVGLLLPILAFLIFVRARTPRQYLAGWLVQFAAQPFWLAVTYAAEQWPMFVVSLFFLLIAMHGVMRFAGEVRAAQKGPYE